MEPPEWEPSGKGEVIRVVYPIEYMDGRIEYHFGERDDVLKNLYAHISNNLMDKTFEFVKAGLKPHLHKRSKLLKRKRKSWTKQRN